MVKHYNPTSPGRRFRRTLNPDVDSVKPLKSKTKGRKNAGGRNRGRIATRHRSGGTKKLYRDVDFKRNKTDVPAKVANIEYDPNRGANIARLHYADGEKGYILAPGELKRGDTVVSAENTELQPGNSMPLKNIPMGTVIHNIEVNPGAGGKIARGAGNSAQLIAKEGNYVNVKLPSGEVKKILGDCRASIGTVGNVDKRNIKLGKAGVKKYLGRRSEVRGVAMSDPGGDHPHAGSYSTSGIGMHPKSPWGWKTLGVKTRKRKRTDYTIVKGRKKKK